MDHLTVACTLLVNLPLNLAFVLISNQLKYDDSLVMTQYLLIKSLIKA